MHSRIPTGIFAGISIRIPFRTLLWIPSGIIQGFLQIFTHEFLQELSFMFINEIFDPRLVHLEKLLRELLHEFSSRFSPQILSGISSIVLLEIPKRIFSGILLRNIYKGVSMIFLFLNILPEMPHCFGKSSDDFFENPFDN